MISVFLIVAALAQGTNEIEVPVNSPFKLGTSGEGRGSPVLFKGEMSFHAEYLLEWRIVDDVPEMLILRIFPDAKTLGLLPFAPDAPPTELNVFGAEEVAKQLLNTDSAQVLLGGNVLSEFGSANFRVGELQTAIDCDSRSYTVEILSVEAPQVVAQTAFIPQRRGC